ncbi:hypothetical protein MT418_005141 [Batrachochytrium dendrobatidis]
MVQIHISGQLNPTHSTSNTVILVELQGSIEAQAIVGSDNQVSVSGIHIGEMFIDKDTALLYIGNHILDGRKVGLLKPLAILAKVASTKPHGMAISNQSNGPDISAQDSQSVVNIQDRSKQHIFYEAVHLITHKYVFKTRPQHLVTAHNKDFAGLTPHIPSVKR